MNKNEKGFSAVELLALMLVIGLIIGTGWYVLNKQKPKDTTNKSVANNQSVSTKLATCDIKSDVVENSAYKDWQTYTSTKVKVSFKHPSLSTLVWSKISEKELIPLASANDGDVYYEIDGEQAVTGTGGGPSTIITFMKGNLLGRGGDVGATRKELNVKGVKGTQITQKVENVAGNTEYNTYYLYRSCTNDTVRFDLSNNHEKYFDDAYKGMFDTLVLSQ